MITCQSRAWWFVVLLMIWLAYPAVAAITQTGNVVPGVNLWTGSTNARIGSTSNGSVTVAGGSLLTSRTSLLGENSGATGMATITGAGSRWTNSRELEVGVDGTGTLTIEAGGEVGNTAGYLGYQQGSTGTATVTGAGSKWTNSNALLVGRSGTGTLTIEAGGEVRNTSGYLGDRHGSSGTAIVSGAGSKWTNSDFLYVGFEGTGSLTVSDGGQVSARALGASLSDLHGNGAITALEGAILDTDIVFDATHGASQSLSFGSGGTLNININGGELGVGYKQTGSLAISEGVSISSSTGFLGRLPGSTGTAAVAGAGSKWTNSNQLYVGYLGNGTLTIQAGGEVSNTAGHLGAFTPGSTGTATVTGLGSKWTNSDWLHVGDSGSGTLTIEAGGEVSNTTGFIGLFAGSSGTATVTGAGSKWINSDFLYVNVFGTGSLTVSDGGQVVARTLVASLSDLHGNGTITATEGALLDTDLVFDAAHGTSQSLSFGSGGTLNINVKGGELGVGYKQSGSLNISQGVSISSSSALLGENPGSTGTATVTGTGSQWTNGGNFLVGNNGVGTLTIENGGLVSVGGMLSINSSGSSVNMTKGGMLALAGEADDSLGQFLGLVQGTDAIRFWNDTLSDWAHLTSATLGVDYWLENITTGDLAGYTLLTVGENKLRGDFNRDGRVDAADYVVWRNGLETTHTIDHYHLWRDNYGATAPEATVAETIQGAAVPEPASPLVLASAALVLATAHRHHLPSRVE